jgi:hypothetical protein
MAVATDLTLEEQREALKRIVEGQGERNIVANSIKNYISKVKVMTKMLTKFPDIRENALETDEEGRLMFHTGAGSGIHVIRFPMTGVTVKELFAMISADETLPTKKRRREDDIDLEACELIDDSNNPAANKVTVTAQSFQNYKSALRWWHEYDCPRMNKKGSPWSESADAAARSAIATYKRDIGSKKRRGIMSKKEGKNPYNITGYVTICKYFMKMAPKGNSTTWNEGLFASLFTKLSVNSIGRSDNIDDLMLRNIDWENDALTLSFGTTKADQTGESTSDKKRMYSNPFLPCVCVILDLAVNIWCKHRTCANECLHVFDGKDQNKRYYNNLVDAVKNIPDHVDLGCNRSDIGTHSNRKFAESTSVSKIDGPSRTQVCLRAGQGVGRTQDCYMFSEEDGDALVGRTVAQLKLDADEFDVLPPHFGTQTLQELHGIGWSNILAGYEHYPLSFQRVVPYLLAHLVYHWFAGNLALLYDQRHPLFQQKLFTHPALLNSLKDKVILAHAYCADTRMSAQGVPGIIMISREVREFRKHYDATNHLYNGRIDELNDKQQDSFDKLPHQIIELLLAKFQVNGIIPVSIDEIRSLITATLTPQFELISGSLAALSSRMDTSTNQARITSATNEEVFMEVDGDDASTGNRFDLFRWPGDIKFHRVPHMWEFPSFTCKTMWELWFFGNEVTRIRPYRYFIGCHDMGTKACGTNLSRTKRIMKDLVGYACEEGLIRSARDITAENSDAVFGVAYRQLLDALYRVVPERPGDININTLCNRLYK